MKAISNNFGAGKLLKNEKFQFIFVLKSEKIYATNEKMDQS